MILTSSEAAGKFLEELNIKWKEQDEPKIVTGLEEPIVFDSKPAQGKYAKAQSYSADRDGSVVEVIYETTKPRTELAERQAEVAKKNKVPLNLFKGRLIAAGPGFILIHSLFRDRDSEGTAYRRLNVAGIRLMAVNELLPADMKAEALEQIETKRSTEAKK